MRLARILATFLVGVLLAPLFSAVATPARAQQPKRPPVAERAAGDLLAGCATPAARIDWEESILYLGIGSPRRDTISLTQMYRLLLLQDLTARLRALLPPAGSSDATPGDSGARLPSGDGRYAPTAAGASLRFVLRGDGTLGAFRGADSARVGRADSSRFPERVRRTDTLFLADLRRTLERMSAERAILPIPDREPTDSVVVFLGALAVERTHTPVKLDTSEALWPVFTLTVPRMKPAAPAGGASPRFPESARLRGVRGTLVMEFVVDQDGRVDTASIRDLRKPGDVPARYERDYQAFVGAVRRALPRMKYTPAEVMGCRVKQRVSQPFVFGYDR